MNEVYYKIYLSPKDNLLHCICLQSFDEPDYNQNKFATDPLTDEHLKFNSEQECLKYLNEWFPQQRIHPDYHIPDALRLDAKAHVSLEMILKDCRNHINNAIASGHPASESTLYLLRSNVTNALHLIGKD